MKKTGKQASRSGDVATDYGQFDGSADPNPGGRMGWGWHLTINGEDLPSGSGEEQPKPDNTNNSAEYMGLIALLKDYIARGGHGPLEVRGDSQLVIKQVTGVYSIGKPHLWVLADRVHSLVEQISGGVTFQWVPREKNEKADMAASGDSKPGTRFSDEWGNQTKLGAKVGMTAVEVGRRLRELGLRDQSGAATSEALDKGYAKSTPLRDGTPFYLWNVAKLMPLLSETTGAVSE